MRKLCFWVGVLLAAGCGPATPAAAGDAKEASLQEDAPRRGSVLSPEFPEVRLEAVSDFAHDRGMISRVTSVQVAGVECPQDEVLQKLVAHRKGWTPAGGSSDEEVVATLRAFVDAWSTAVPHSIRVVSQEAPEGFPPGQAASYHPPRFEIRTLDDGGKIVVHSYWTTWDGGNHGTQWGQQAEAFRVADGARYALP